MVGRRRKQRSTHRQHYRSEPGSFVPDTVITWPGSYRKVHHGIDRLTRVRTAPDLPVTDFQAEVLALLTPELQRPADLARTLGRTPSSVTATLYALADRKLAEKVPYKGWRLTDAP